MPSISIILQQVGQIFHMAVLFLWDMWLLSQVVMHTEDKPDKMQAGKQTVILMLQKNKTKTPSKIRVFSKQENNINPSQKGF